ncbi:MAG: UDP-N-acetylmuramoyl-L-alanyl-D-glutamate--2,6-diaminopimelate ligase [Acidimicrobiales bacterium]|nr:UDP-N-acetylmuramoyl-L-alanyl-D-glutamate--2,6-diaminopimelate ligase [Acidimicrobiales bacterium]
MMLDQIISKAEEANAGASYNISERIDGIEITALSFDSRTVKSGDLFFCISGEHHDGHDFAPMAAAAGAAAFVVERRLEIPNLQIIVPNVREAMGYISCAYFEFPSNEITVIGITGTNGKTTTTELINGILNLSGRPSEAIGTLTGELTTPEAPNLQSQIRAMVNSGVSAVVMEVSSHALSQHRTTGIEFDIGVFTNLTQDHLDYHMNLEEYFETKCMLFAAGKSKSAIVNIDDYYGSQLAERTTIPTVEISLRDIKIIEERFSGTTIIWNGKKANLQLSGRFNIDNVLLAASTCQLLGIGEKEIIHGLEAADPIPGRFEVVSIGGESPIVIVDYSHTPAGIENVLKSVRYINPKVAVSVVFGCGGERDSLKRPEMAKLAERYADRVILTSDNPRNEDPEKIISETMSGFRNPTAVIVEADRKAAIETAITNSPINGVVVVAGKGDEAVQEIDGKREPFDDRIVAREVLSGVIS